MLSVDQVKQLCALRIELAIRVIEATEYSHPTTATRLKEKWDIMKQAMQLSADVLKSERFDIMSQFLEKWEPEGYAKITTRKNHKRP